MRILVSGASGLIGTALVAHLRQSGHDVAAVGRSGGDLLWNPARGELNEAEVAGADAVVCLNGAPIGRPWTPAYKENLRRSRLTSVQTWIDAFTRLPDGDRPSHLVTASAVGYYGQRPGQILDEESGGGDDFLARLCQSWERTAQKAETLGLVVSHLRTGLVMSRDGGLLKPLALLARAGLGGPLGDGTQMMSPIWIGDHVRAVEFILRTTIAGPVNLTGPEPVSNAEWTATLGSVLDRPTLLRVPKWALAALEMGRLMPLADQAAVPAVLEDHGFAFEAPTVGEMLAAELG